MKYLDRFLQDWRGQQAARWVPDNARVLDIGCFQGEFLSGISSRIARGVGMDPLAKPRQAGNLELRRAAFEDRLPFSDATFDALARHLTAQEIVEVTMMVDWHTCC